METSINKTIVSMWISYFYNFCRYFIEWCIHRKCAR